jgi:hypothetical protein
MIGLREESEEEFKTRLKRFSDEKLMEVAKACAWKCPYPHRDENDLRIEARRKVQLAWCREEWRRRHPKTGETSERPSEPSSQS